MENQKERNSYWEFNLNWTTDSSLVYIEIYHEERHVETIFGSDIEEAIEKLEKFMHPAVLHTFLAMRHCDMKTFVSKIKAY